MNEDITDQSSVDKKQNKDGSNDIFLEPNFGIKGEPIGDDRTHKSFLGGISFITRRWLIAITGIIAFCGLAGLLFKSDQLLTYSFQQVRTSSNLSKQVFKIESEIVALNSDSNNFIRTKNLRYAENYDKRAEKIINDLKTLAENPQFPTIQKLATTIYDGIGEHKKQFSKIIKIQDLLGFNKKIGIQPNANESFATLEKQLSQLNATKLNPELQNLLGEIKISEIKFAEVMDTEKQKYVNKLISRLIRLLDSSVLKNKEKKILETLIQSHRNDVAQLSRTYSIYRKAKTRLGEISSYIAPSIDTMINYNGNFSLLARQESQKTQQLIRKIVIIGGTSILILLISFHMIIIRSISVPGTKIAENAVELAHGNVSAPIPFLANSDPIGQLSNALTIFRENMLQADSLRKDLEIARQENFQPNIESIPNAHNLQNINQHQDKKISSEEFQEEKPVIQDHSLNDNTISDISNKITTTSQNASDAFEEVEKTEIMVSGLDDTTEKIEDIEILMIGISDQISLLAVQTALHSNNVPNDKNLVHLYEKRDKRKPKIKSGSGQSVDDRIKSIQDETKRVIKEVQKIGVTVHEVNEVAKEISNSISQEALEAANQLLKQSEDLRTILDNILDKTQNENTIISKPKI